MEEVEIPGARVAAKKLHTQLINLGSPHQALTVSTKLHYCSNESTEVPHGTTEGVYVQLIVEMCAASLS